MPVLAQYSFCLPTRQLARELVNEFHSRANPDQLPTCQQIMAGSYDWYDPYQRATNYDLGQTDYRAPLMQTKLMKEDPGTYLAEKPAPLRSTIRGA